MILPILILSAIFIAIAFTVNENNAKYLLSGYNTMSEVERENFDIKSYMVYFRKFHIFLGVTLLLIAVGLLYFVNSDWSGLFLGTYPLFAYVFFIWKSNQFTKNKSKKQRITTYIAMGVMSLLLLIILYEFKSCLTDNGIIVHNDQIEITGEYGTAINISDLKSIELADQLPEISSKTNGLALETIQKGYFRTAGGENVKLLINSEKTPILLFTTNDNQKIYYSSKDKSNEEIYKAIKGKVIH
ncbi:DUF3784 domain-containing protein [Flavobacterium sp.]|uniref:DUF3784 domain-containing protein n=1 Tax=Flavobacterium sp. TaxID=239 RepID=UPI00260C2E66|nr:DUF3784 domain-containing protein [Flavobacterium sp.]